MYMLENNVTLVRNVFIGRKGKDRKNSYQNVPSSTKDRRASHMPISGSRAHGPSKIGFKEGDLSSKPS
jgi:hypothetical protein